MNFETEMIGNLSVMRASGRVDAHTSGPLKQWIDEACSVGGNSQLLLNMKETTFIDTHAISLLVGALKYCGQKEGQFMLCNLAQPVRIIFELMRLDRAFTIYPDEATALASLSAA